MSAGRPFVARLFESPAIKSWKETDAPRLRAALAACLDAIRGGGPLVLDLMVEFEAEDLEPKLAASTVLFWRSRRRMNLGSRLMRRLGIFSGDSTLAAAVLVGNGAQVNDLLPGSTLWDSEFSIYPAPAVSMPSMKNPHFEIPGFAAVTAWSVNQDTGSPSWLITARGVEGLDMVCATMLRAFEMNGLAASTSDAPVDVYG